MASIFDKARQLAEQLKKQAVNAVNPRIASPIPRPNPPSTLKYRIANAQEAVLKPLVKVQQYAQSPQSTRIIPKIKAPQGKYPGLNIISNVGTTAANIGGDIVNTIVGKGVIDPGIDMGRMIGSRVLNKPMPDYNTLKSSYARLGYNIQGSNNSPQQIIGNVAESINTPFTAYGGGKVFGLGKNAVEQVGKQSLKKIIIEGAKTGAKYGATTGALQGVSEGRGDKNVVDQIMRGGKGGTIGGVVGGITGGAISGLGYSAGQISEGLKTAYKQINPQASEKETTKAVNQFIRDELGRFAKQGKTKQEPVYYGDLRESLGLPRTTNYQSGAIDFTANVGKNSKDTTPNYTPITLKDGKVSKLNPVENIKQLLRSSTKSGESVIESRGKAMKGMTGEQLPKNKSGLDKIGTPEVPSTPDSFINNVKTNLNKLYTETIDRFHPLSQTAKKAGKEQAMQNALTQHYGAASTGEYHVDYELKPILQSVGNVDDLRDYTIAMRDFELAKRGIRGSDEKAAQKNLNKLSQKYRGDISQFRSAANNLYDYQRNIVKTYLVDTGVISKEAYQSMLTKNQFYVPFKRVMDKVDGFLGYVPQQKGVGSVGSQNVIKDIKGSERKIIDPLQSIVENTYKMVSLGRRNQVAKTIVSLKDQLPGSIKPFDGEVGNKPVISVFENGKVRKYLVPKDVAEAAKGLNEESLNTVVKLLSIPTKILRASATGYNPEFQAPNVIRDLQNAFVNAGLNPLRFAQGLAHLVKKDDVYQEYLKSGAKTSSLVLDRPSITKTVSEITDKSPKGVTTYIPKKPSDLLKILQKMGESSEQPTRIALFEQSLNKGLKAGLSREEAQVRAANAAQEGTVNFARRGTVTAPANALIAFLNARAQGVDRLARTIKNDPVGGLTRMALISQTPAVITYLWNRQFPTYFDNRVVPEKEKENNFILMLNDKTYVKLPKAEVGRFANPTENFLSYLDKKGDNNALMELGKAFGSFSPVNSIGDVIPTAIRPIVENAANYNFYTKQPLVPDYKKALPPAYQYNSYTAPQYKLIGKKTNVSPSQIENVASGYLTGFEKITSPLVGKLAETIDPSVANKNVKGEDVNRIPLLRRFVGGERRTLEEDQLYNEKQSQSIDFQISDVAGAVKRGDIPLEEGKQRIKELLLEKNQFQSKDRIQGIINEFKTMSPEQKKSYLLSKYKSGNLSIDDIKEMAKRMGVKDQAQDTDFESIKRLRVQDRGTYILSQLKGKTPEQKRTLLTELYKRKILTKDVLREMASSLKR